MGSEIILIIWLSGEWFFGTRGHQNMESCEDKAERTLKLVPHLCISRDELMQKLQGEGLDAPN